MADFQFLRFKSLRDEFIKLKIKELREADESMGFFPTYCLTIHLTDTDEEIGWIDLRVGDGSATYYGGHIGYSVREKHRGNGYAVRAVHLIKPLAIKHGLQQLIISCNPKNRSSQRVCEKAGFTLKGIVILPEDCHLYSTGEREACLYTFRLIES